MRVLVTGGGGFVGSALVRALAAAGDTAIALDRRSPDELATAAESAPGIVPRQGDVGDLADLQQVLRAERPDAVVHCAAVVGVLDAESSPAQVFRINVEGSIALFEAMKREGPRRVIHIGSEEAYGDFQADVIDETHPLAPRNVYGISKAAVEQLGRVYRRSDGLECITLRTSWVYGPGLPRARVPRTLVEAALARRPLHLPHGGDSRIDQTYIDDLVAGTLLALRHPEHPHDCYHVASGRSPSLAEMVGWIEDCVPGAEISIGPGAYRHDGQTEIPRKGALDCTRARETFGYRPRFDLKSGLAAYVAALRGGTAMTEVA